ncbi:putative ABC transporter substrate-binding protein YesO [Bombiscardovia nodaiensis]|uniref:ABC transporter substrate-binding protein YesO n=1 Tax=Bombiscardovia nodaiensis TaxID=2932181 RepID=A0ABM8B6Y3_9BIFI|nr:putative ABC transporter substrate-binding protein YesO [Bombiscardovia nodaiensis]
MKNAKKLLAIVAAGAALVSMTACGSSNGGSGKSGSKAESGTLSVAWWGNQDRNARQAKVNQAFEAAHKDVKVQGQFFEWNDYWKKLSTQVAGHQMPDVIAMDYSYLKQYVDNGQLLELDKYISDGTIKTAGISKDVLASGQMKGKQYAISLGSSSPAMIYNKTVLDKAGLTMPQSLTLDEFEKMSKTVYEKTGYKTNFRYYEASELLEYVLRGEGKTLFKDKELGVSASELKPYFQVYQNGIDQGWHLSPTLFTEIQTGSVEQDPVVYGTSPDRQSWVSFKFTSQLPAMQKVAKDQDLELAPWPSANLKKANYVKPGMFYAISKTCKNPDLAAKYIDFYTNNDEAVKDMLTDRGLPIAEHSLKTVTPMLSADEQKVVKFLQDVVIPNSSKINPPSPSAATTVNTQTLPQVEEALLYKKTDATAAAKQFHDEANDALKR